MELLTGFTSKEFIEQITILQEIESQKNQEVLPDLLELCKSIPADGSLSYMLENALKAVLSENEVATVNELGLEHDRLKRLCIQLSGQKQFKSAGPVLTGLLETTREPDLLFDIFSALSLIKLPESLGVFQQHMTHSTATISTLCIEIIGSYGDSSSVPGLCELVETAEQNDRFLECEFATIKAIEALGAIRDDRAVSFLCTKIHHRNPRARQVIHEQLLQIGPDILPYLSGYFDQDDVDNKIMAANILGEMGSREGGDILVEAMDKGAADHPNTRFAIYEAFGKFFFMKGLACLVDGLFEENETVLMAVVSSLDKQINPGVVKKIETLVCAEDARRASQSSRLIRAIISAKAVSIFEALYKVPSVAGLLVERISVSNDPEIISAFMEKLNQMTGAQAQADAARLDRLTLKKVGKKVLAVDGSAPILLFYRSVASMLGIDIVTAVNGREALDLLEDGQTFDMIITDMNLPVMNGIEFIREVRLNPWLADIQIIMATTESDSSQVQLAENAGGNDFLIKPFTADSLQAKLEGLIF